MVSFGLNKNLATLTQPASLREMAFRLIQWAENEGALDVLVLAACDVNPGNEKLRKFKEQVGPRILEFVIEEGDITKFEADVVALKYAQYFFGADRTVAKLLETVGVEPSILQ